MTQLPDKEEIDNLDSQVNQCWGQQVPDLTISVLTALETKVISRW